MHTVDRLFHNLQEQGRAGNLPQYVSALLLKNFATTL